MKSFSSSIIPKFIGIFSLVAALSIFLLFFFERKDSKATPIPRLKSEELFAHILKKGMPEVLKIWQEGKSNFPKQIINCPEEIIHNPQVGESYYQCQPHFWQCYWSGGVNDYPEIKVEYNDKLYHIEAKSSYASIPSYSANKRFYEIQKINSRDIPSKFVMKIEMKVKEVEGFSQEIALFDTCRDTYLPQRIYPYGHESDLEKTDWDNFYREIYFDRFYVSNEKVNQWRILSNRTEKIIKDRTLWPMPALLDLKEQIQYCAFWGKRLMEAKIFDAASMTPGEIENAQSTYILRPQTFWQRDIKKTFLGISRLNPDYELTPLDCDLVQVKGCPSSFYSVDSVTWSGLNYSQGFYAESLANTFDHEKNLKVSSREKTASFEGHELGKRGTWDGIQEESTPVAFRCYEEIE